MWSSDLTLQSIRPALSLLPITAHPKRLGWLVCSLDLSAYTTMASSKAGFEAELAHPCDSESQQNVSEKKGTASDQRDMLRMGKQQELRRNFGLVSIFGYSMILMATWENSLTWVYLLQSLST